MAQIGKMTVRLKFQAFDSWLLRVTTVVVLVLFFWAFFQTNSRNEVFNESIDRFNALSDRYESFIVELEDGE
jgi:hypothetical protein